MSSFAFFKWFKNVSIAKKLYFTVGIMALLIAFELVTLWFSINTLSSVRAYVEGEGLWSKAQKDAIYQLRKYRRTNDEADYIAFQNFMKVPSGDHKARLELMKDKPDWDIARQGFSEGRNHPKDIDKMMTLFRRFHDISYIKKAINLWAEADLYAEQLIPIGEKLHAEINSPSPSQEKIEGLIQQVDSINTQVTSLEDDFSFTLGEGSRWLENLILKLLFSVALTVEISGLLLTISVSRGIAKGIKEIVGASKSIAKGNFNTRAKYFSQDEIGVLANSFNLMADDLRVQKDKENRAEESLKQQKELYETLVNAQSEMGEGVTVTEGQKIIYVNPALCKMYGYSAEEILSMPSFFDFVVEEDKERLLKRFRERFSGLEKSDTGETSVMRKDGKIINIEYSLKSINSGNKTQLVSIIRDITQRKEIEEKIRESEERFRLIVENVRDYAIFMVDVKGHVKSWNQGAERIKGYTANEIIGKPISIFYTAEEMERGAPDYNLKMAAEKGRHESEGWRVKKDGSQFFADVVITALHDEQGKLQGYVKVTRDVTEKQKAQINLKEKNEELARSNKELEHFAYIASHDLQEPLRTVTSYVQLLQKKYKGKLDKDADEFIEFAVDGTTRMRALINDLLTYSRVGTQPKEFAGVNIKDVLKTVAINLKPRIDESNAQLIVDPMPTIRADESQMRQLFQNLIANAIKFRSDKEPQIKISAEEAGMCYLFSVEDNGIGIPKEYEQKIFQLFQRLHDRGKYPGGTGIGLAICKKIVELHGGEIWIEPNDKKGTTFYFTIKS